MNLFMYCLPSMSSWKSRLRLIYRSTRQHAFNLAKFVSIYKTLILLQKKMNSGKERNTDTFVAGLIGGYIVFGERNAVNEQVDHIFHRTIKCGLLKKICILFHVFRLCSTSCLVLLLPSFLVQPRHITLLQSLLWHLLL